jgi:hypothetical protein
MSDPVPVPVSIPAPFKIVLDTGVPVNGPTDMVAFGVGDKALGESAKAFEKALGAISGFLVEAKDTVEGKLVGAESVTFSCGLSLTVGASYFVELSATGDFNVSATWKLP